MASKNRPLIDDYGGNIGIGTISTPTSKLQVGGNITPDLPSTYSLGIPSAYWSSSYVLARTGSNISIGGTLIAGGLIDAQGITINVKTPFTSSFAFAFAFTLGTIYPFGGAIVTSSNDVNGTRYIAGTNAVINCGANANFFPGNIAGYTVLGGLYV